MTEKQEKSKAIVDRTMALLLAECEIARNRTVAFNGMNKAVTLEILFRDGCPISIVVSGEKYSDMKSFTES